MKNVFLLLTALLFIFACNRKDKTDIPAPTAFVEIPVGRVMEYSVIDTTYLSSTGTYEANAYFRKEWVNAAIQDLLEREVKRVFLYSSPDSVDSLGAPVRVWTYDSTWQYYLDQNVLERIEANVRYVVLRFPVKKGTRWNGNIYNSEPSQEYIYRNADTTVTVNGVTYEHCVYVLQQPFESLTPSAATGYFGYLRHAYEIYAPGIGRIERRKLNLVWQRNSTGSAPALQLSEAVNFHEYLWAHN